MPLQRRRSSALLFLAASLVLWFGREPILTAAGGYLIQQDAPAKADAIVVLGGDHYGDRVLKGAELAKQGYAPVVYVSGPPRLMGFESTDGIQYAEQKGYPPEMFREARLPAEASSSRSEAQFLGGNLRRQGVRSVLLVTSNFHTRRAAKMWRLANPDFRLIAVGSADPYFGADRWWKSREGQKTFVYEWLKTVTAWFGI